MKTRTFGASSREFGYTRLLIGLIIASLYLRIPTIGPTVVKFRTWFFVGAYVVLALGVVSKSL